MTLNESTTDEQRFQEALDKDFFGRLLKLVETLVERPKSESGVPSSFMEFHKGEFSIYISYGILTTINARFKDEAVFNASAAKDVVEQISNYVPREDWENILDELEELLPNERN